MMDEGDDYDPHTHRVEWIKNPTTNMETLYHLFKACLGTGVLALPEAFKMAGMINGIISTFFIGIFCTYCLHILIRGQYVLCKKRKVGLLRYGESMKVACEVGPEFFKPHGKFVSRLTDVILVVYQTGVCCVYVVFVGTSTKHVVEAHTSKNLGLYIYMLVFLIPFFLILLVKSLKVLAPLSLVADILTMVTFGVVFYYIFEGLDAKFTDRNAIGRLVDYPLLFGTVLFSLQSVPIVIALENNMATPKGMRKPLGPLNLAFGLLTLIYITVAVFGFWRYGDDIQSTITMNFPITEVFAQVIIISYCLALYVSYGLNAYVPLSILLDLYILKKLDQEELNDIKKKVYDVVLRAVFAIVTFFFATSIPLLGLFISLIGSVCLSALGVIFPAFIEIAANWEEKLTRPGTICFWKNMVVGLVGVFGLFCGGYSAIRGIVETLMSGEY